MKRLIVFCFLSLLAFKEASARKLPLPYCSSCEYVEHVAELPDSAQFYSEEYKTFVDVAYLYKQFWVLWVPLWNFDGKYVLAPKDQEVYFDVSKEELDSYKLDLPENPISFWNKIGGKLVVLALIALVLYGYFGRGGSDEETAGGQHPSA